MLNNAGVPIAAPVTTSTGAQAGGYCLGFSGDDAGTTVAHNTDVGCAYIRQAGVDKRWRRVISYQNFNIDGGGWLNGDTGVFSIAVAPSNGARVYFVFRGRLMRSDDRCVTLTRATGSFPGDSNEATGLRLWNDKLAVDPVNPDALLIGTEGSGAYYSIDGAATAPVKVAGPPDVTVKDKDNRAFPVLVAYDRSSATVNGRKQRAAMWVPGSCVWITTTGVDGTWTLSSGGPTNTILNSSDSTPIPSFLIFGPDGTLYAGPGANSTVHQLSGSTWSDISIGFNAATMAFLANGQKVACSANHQWTWTTAAAPNTWTGQTLETGTASYKANKIAWLDAPLGAYLSTGKIWADPQVAGKVWIAHGTGIGYRMIPTGSPNSGVPYKVFDDSDGNTMLVTLDAVSLPNGAQLYSAWDKGSWYGETDAQLDNPAAFFSQSDGISMGWSIDYIPGYLDRFVRCQNYFSQQSGISRDKGRTWTTFTDPSGVKIGGNIAFVSDTEGYWVTNDRPPMRTTDGGSTWTYFDMVTQGGTHLNAQPTNQSYGFATAYYFKTKRLISSKEEPGVAYMWSSTSAFYGLWHKEAGSLVWTQIVVGTMGNNEFDFNYNCNLSEVPGHAGNLYFLSGGVTSQDPYLRRSTNRGANWSAVTTSVGGVAGKAVTSIQSLGYGRNLPGASWPAIRFCGNVGGAYGVWETLDNFATSTFLEARPLYYLEPVSSIAGDLSPTGFGRWRYGVGQQGWARSDRKHLVKLS